MEESGWVMCNRCCVMREWLLEMPCCASLFCVQCLKKTGRCFQCGKTFDVNRCSRHIPMSSVISANLQECPHPGCDRKLDSLLLDHHKENCVFAPPSEVAQLDPNFQSKEEMHKQYQMNLYRSYESLFSKPPPTKRPMIKTKVISTTNEQFYTHIIMPTDTLMGLALKYGVTVSEIRTENRLTSGANLHERATLRIPVRKDKIEEETLSERDKELLMQKRLVASFRRQARGNVSNDEAFYYLNLTQFDLSASLSIYADDITWATDNPPPSSRFQKSGEKEIKEERSRKMTALIPQKSINCKSEEDMPSSSPFSFCSFCVF